MKKKEKHKPLSYVEFLESHIDETKNELRSLRESVEDYKKELLNEPNTEYPNVGCKLCIRHNNSTYTCTEKCDNPPPTITK